MPRLPSVRKLGRQLGPVSACLPALAAPWRRTTGKHVWPDPALLKEQIAGMLSGLIAPTVPLKEERIGGGKSAARTLDVARWHQFLGLVDAAEKARNVRPYLDDSSEKAETKRRKPARVLAG
jgi:hypothetical protein